MEHDDHGIEHSAKNQKVKSGQWFQLGKYGTVKGHTEYGDQKEQDHF
tara:strand:- start:953 stop:1093 length:141 start_codon:yes stop_codon:yes gene_type:complete